MRMILSFLVRLYFICALIVCLPLILFIFFVCGVTDGMGMVTHAFRST